MLVETVSLHSRYPTSDVPKPDNGANFRQGTDDHTLMADHIKLLTKEVGKTLAQVEEDWAKSWAESEERKRSPRSPVSPISTVLGFSPQKCVIKGQSRTIHRIFVQTANSGYYSNLGWVLKRDMECCMVCSKDFQHIHESYFSYGIHAREQIHCRACGNIVCESCASYEAIVEGLHVLGPVPVCVQCYFGQVSNFFLVTIRWLSRTRKGF